MLREAAYSAEAARSAAKAGQHEVDSDACRVHPTFDGAGSAPAGIRRRPRRSSWAARSRSARSPDRADRTARPRTTSPATRSHSQMWRIPARQRSSGLRPCRSAKSRMLSQCGLQLATKRRTPWRKRHAPTHRAPVPCPASKPCCHSSSTTTPPAASPWRALSS